jgi:hypothetical protein
LSTAQKLTIPIQSIHHREYIAVTSEMTGTTIILITMIMLGSCHGFSVSPKAHGTKILQGSRTWGSTLLFAKVLPQDLDESIPISDRLPEKILKEIALEAEECQKRHEEHETNQGWTNVLTTPFHVLARQSSHNEIQAGMFDDTPPIDELISDKFLNQIALDAEPHFNEHFSMVDDTTPIDELLPQAFFVEIALKAEGLRGRKKQYKNQMLTPPFNVPASKTGHSSKQASMVDDVPVEELLSDEFMTEIALEAEEKQYENHMLTPPFNVPASKTGHSSKQASIVDDVPVEELLSDEFMTEIDLEEAQAALDAERSDGYMI